MDTSTINHNVSFGLNYNTHRKITQKLINEEYPKLQKYVSILKSSVEAPDFDELGVYCNTHFYFPVESYFRPRESFLDLDGEHNARSKFNTHIINFHEALKNFKFEKMLDQAGRAKHFLDDVCVGLHVQRGNAFRKWRDVPMHRDFETFIYENEDYFIKNAKKSPVKFKTGDFDDIFMSVVSYSQHSEFPNNANKNRWNEIAQNTINVVLDSSRVFFDKISEYLL